MPYGTLTTFDTLASSQQTVAQFGEDRAFQGVTEQLTAYNMVVQEGLADLVDVTTDNLRRYGGAADLIIDEYDQMGRPDASKTAQGSNVGFPLRKQGATLQWTRDYFEVAIASEFAGQVNAQLSADLYGLHRRLRRAIFNPTNTTFNDALVANVALPIKAFVNADSAAIPLGPNAETFDASTHTHFLGTGSFVASDLDALIDTVTEHYNAGMPVVEINRAQETAVRAFTGFAPLTDIRVTNPTTATVGVGALDVVNFNNRLIGYYRGAEVWVKSARIPASYVFAWMKGVGKPLAMRVRNAARGQLRLVADNENFPLRAQSREREYGFGVWERTAGAVLYTGNATYAAPSI